jgi:uncharacterized phage protein (TIGR02218 family)
MKQLDSGLAAHIVGGLTTLCRCWLVERKDGLRLGFTDHDRDLSFDGVTYQAASGFTASTLEDQLGLAVSNLDVAGALSSTVITEADLHVGRYDDASVTVYLVNWQDASQQLILRSGFLGQVSRGAIGFTAELRGLASRLDQAAGRIFQRTCPWALGDTRCRIDLAAAGRHGAGTVDKVLSAFDFTAAGLDGLATGVFSRGRLVWTSGANDGLALEVKSHSAGAGVARFSLLLPVPEPMEAGDAFTVTAGCDKTFETCRDRFANVVNFGGFPHMTGNDFALSYPTQGSDNDGGSLS